MLVLSPPHLRQRHNFIGMWGTQYALTFLGSCIETTLLQTIGVNLLFYFSVCSSILINFINQAIWFDDKDIRLCFNYDDSLLWYFGEKQMPYQLSRTVYNVRIVNVLELKTALFRVPTLIVWTKVVHFCYKQIHRKFASAWTTPVNFKLCLDLEQDCWRVSNV